jgi:hypothetical protein
MRFSIFRYNPERDEKPYMQAFEVDLEPTDRMLLDAILRIKDSQDDSLTLRKSCREGVCGSDAMNINGRNGLACVTPVRELREPVELRPLPSFPVIRDLVVDMTQFFKQYHSIKPYLVNDEDRQRRNACSLRKNATSWMAHTSASCVRAAPANAPRRGGTRTSCWAGRTIYRHIGSLSTAVIELPRNGWMIERSLSPIPLSHDHELHRGLPERAVSVSGH